MAYTRGVFILPSHQPQGVPHDPSLRNPNVLDPPLVLRYEAFLAWYSGPLLPKPDTGLRRGRETLISFRL